MIVTFEMCKPNLYFKTVCIEAESEIAAASRLLHMCKLVLGKPEKFNVIKIERV